MKWDVLKKELKLDEEQASAIEVMLNQYKNQFTELCMHKTEKGGESPIGHAAKINIDFPELDQDAFGKKFLEYLSLEHDSVSKSPYIETVQNIELSVRKKINSLLSDEQKRTFHSQAIDCLMDINTGHDPFVENLSVEISNKKTFNAGEDEITFFSETFCILPWMHTFVDVNGDVKLCCYAAEGLTKPPLNMQQQSLRDIWNSDEMKEVRRRMVEGKKVAACRNCNRQSEMKQTANRVFYNHRWLMNDGEKEKFRSRVLESIHKDYAVHQLPVFYDLRPGNICSLKCRMCHSDYSRLILNDPVHSKWAYRGAEVEHTRFPDGMRWFEAEHIVIEEILESIDDIRGFYLAGGEPLINPFVTRLIDVLIDRQAAHEISLEFSSNLTVFREDLFEKLKKFKWVHMFLSIDGAGPVYDYIRYPGKWTDMKRNLQKISRYPNMSFAITVTVQNYNALSITDLLEYAESLNIPCNFNLLHSPVYLSIGVMPRKARLLAAKRLKEYADNSSLLKKHPDYAATMANVILELEHNSDKFYHDAMREFMVFTNDLDRSRNQSFKETLPELFEFIKEDGYTWTEEVRHCCPE